MNIDRLLNVITIAAWALLALFTLVGFLRTARRAGVATAVRRLLSVRLIAPLVLLLAVTLLSAALVFIPPQQTAVVISILSPQGIRARPMPAGLHWIVPLAEAVHPYPIYWQTYTMASRAYEGEQPGDDSIVARTADGQQVIFDSSIIFRLDPQSVVRIYIDWQDRYIQDFVRPLVRGIIRDEVAQFTVDEVNSARRQDLEVALQTQLETAFAERGLILDQFVLRNIAFSMEYAASVEEKQVALERATQRVYEAEQIRSLAAGRADEIRALAQAEADAVLVRAEAEAAAQVMRAEAEATALQLVKAALAGDDDLLTYRYIDRLAPGVQVMLLPSDNPFLLPLPDLTGGNVVVEQTPAAAATAGSLTPTPVRSAVSTPEPTTTPEPGEPVTP